ncbi:MAG: magnesium transporter [Flavobacteriales bacterium]|nr:magnesium transporter [Flavobacteriales bacterium]
MQFELTSEFLSALREDMERLDSTTVAAKVEDLYPQDIAEILDEVTLQEGQFIFRLLDEEIRPEVLMELDEDVRKRFLRSLSSEEIAQYVDLLDTDDAADLISELPEARQSEVLDQVEDEEQASDIADLLTYDEDTAGGLMAKELIKVNLNWSLPRCVREMRKQAEEVDTVYTVYVVDDNDRLVGTVSLKQMLIAPERTLIRDIYDEDVHAVEAHTPAEEVAQIAEKYDLVVIPVVDQWHRLIGRITVDDVMDVVREETSKDYQMMSGISENIETTDSAFIMSRARLPWLLIAMGGGILGSQVIEQYEGQLRVFPEMAIFMPLVASMGGNVGIQSSALIVQGLANNTLGRDGILPKLLKELAVGLLNGLACSVAILGYAYFFGHPIALSMTISLSMMIVILFAGFFGTIVPLGLKRFDLDPALATGPFITTANDIIGLFFYFVIGRMMYGFFV